MNKLETLIKNQFDKTPKLKAEFKKFCLLLQAYSDDRQFSYDSDFMLGDKIYWDKNMMFYGGGQQIEMTPVIENFFISVLQKIIWHIQFYMQKVLPKNLVENGKIIFIYITG